MSIVHGMARPTLRLRAVVDCDVCDAVGEVLLDLMDLNIGTDNVVRAVPVWLPEGWTYETRYRILCPKCGGTDPSTK